ncbi:hypothetical protein [Saccharothrix sp. ST-888]|uniref:hypothetical protein n=1 Tax=Saccharothrix sp. ST-888 TaxID=1427391 RepID=UPI0005ECA9BA|nr:hypothetical protein [Saccharothrix sp. ST-888]KJK56007.1 hypothetical protein UK12_25215 [Saccharothrix sp. ST-888]
MAESSEVPVPDLDDLRFQPLVDAAKRVLPQRVPEWTDHNVSDPGVTLLEACAERIDQLLYRVDRMTDRQRNALLRLMGIAPLPASPARVVVALSRSDASTGSREIPAGTEVSTEGEEPVVLRTTAPLTLAAGQSAGTVEAVEQLVPVAEVLGTSDGLPGGRFATARRPWGPGTPVPDPPFGPPVTVRVGASVWRRVPTFAEAGPADPVHWWDDASCEVVFGPLVPTEGGDRQHGAVPPQGARISAEYAVHRGRRGSLPAGTPLSVASPSGLDAVVHRVIAPAADEEDWRQALDRAGLGLAPLRRAVTAADHEQIIEEHVEGLARVRVTALTRPTDSRVPAAFEVPPRPGSVLACAVAARDPERAVHYYYDDGGTITARPLPLERPDPDGRTAPAAPRDEVAVPGPVADANRLDAVIRPVEHGPALWFFEDRCLWDGGPPVRSIREEFPGLPEVFCSDLDEVAVLADPDAADAYELFFFKGEVFHHRAYTYGDRAFLPREGSRGVKSLISEAFPGLSPQCQESPDAVAALDGVFFFVKGPRTEPALWRREDALLHVLLVPRVDADLAAFDEPGLPADLLARVRDVVGASRLLGERLYLGAPRYHHFGVTATVRPWSSTAADSERTRAAAELALRRFFHPTVGGPDGRGWPWGRQVHAGDVLTALEPVPEVRGTTEVGLTLGDGTRPVASVEVSDGGLVLLDTVAVTIAPAED